MTSVSVKRKEVPPPLPLQDGPPRAQQLPQWELPRGYTEEATHKESGGTGTAAVRAHSHGYQDQSLDRAPPAKHRGTLSTKLDRILPKYRTYCGLSRRTFVILLALALLCFLALIVGLAVGLSRRKSSSLFLPLPSDHRQYDGDLTYYGPGLGACGVTSSETDDIVSISHFVFDAEQKGTNPNTNPLCGLKIRATRFDEQVNGMRSVDLTVVDRCTGCQPTDLDVSPGVFSQLADPDKGRVRVTWAYLDAAAPTQLPPASPTGGS